MKPLELIEAEDLVSRYYAGRSIYEDDSHNDFLRWLYETGFYVVGESLDSDRETEQIGEIIDAVTEEIDDEQLHPIS